MKKVIFALGILFAMCASVATQASPGTILSLTPGTGPTGTPSPGDTWVDTTSYNLVTYTQSLKQGAFRCDNDTSFMVGPYFYTTDYNLSNMFCTQPLPPSQISTPWDWGHSTGPGVANAYNEIIGSLVTPAGTYNRTTGLGAIILQSMKNSTDTIAIGSGSLRNAFYGDRDTCVGALCMSWLAMDNADLHKYHQDIWDYYAKGVDPYGATFNGSITGSTLTVDASPPLTGAPIAIGQALFATGAQGNITITGIGPCMGGVCTFTISPTQITPVSDESMMTGTYCAPSDTCWDFDNLNTLYYVSPTNNIGYNISTQKSVPVQGDIPGNTGVGRDALNQLHIGQYNTAMGYKACGHSYVVSLNTCVGEQAGYEAVFATQGVYDGAQSGLWNINGSNNVDVGEQANQWAITANNDTVIGALGVNSFASFTGSIAASSNFLTVIGTVPGKIIPGQTLNDGVTPSNIVNGTTIEPYGTGGTTGTGGDGTYALSQSYSSAVGAEQMTTQLTELSNAIFIGEDSANNPDIVPADNMFLVHVGNQGWNPTINAQMDHYKMCIFCAAILSTDPGVLQMATLSIASTNSGLTSLNSWANDLYVDDSANAGITIGSGCPSPTCTNTESIVMTSPINGGAGYPAVISTQAENGNFSIKASGSILLQGSGGSNDIVLENGSGDVALKVIHAHKTIALPNIALDSGTDRTVCEATGNNELMAGSGTGGICMGTSSARFKHGIAPNADGLNELMAWQTKCWLYNKGYGDNGVRRQCGLVAEDLVGISPQLVGTDHFGRPNTVDWAGEIPIIIKAMQTQQHEIDQQKQEIATLKQEVATSSVLSRRLRQDATFNTSSRAR